MALDLNAWLDDATRRAGLSTEDRAMLSSAIGKNPKVLDYLEESGLRQSDYDRNMNRLKEEHQKRLDEIAAKEAEVDTFQKKVGGWYDENNGKFVKAQEELEKLRVKEAALVERMKRVATQYGVPDEELKDFMASPTNTPPPTPAVPAFDEKKYVSREEAIKEMSAMPLVQAEMLELAEEHRELFGKPLRNAKELVQKAMKANKSIRQVWEDENKVADKRRANDEAAVQARIDKAVAEREIKIRSEVNLPAPRAQEERSPIVDRFAKGRTEQKPTDAGRGLRNAIAAFNEGKYRGDNKAA